MQTVKASCPECKKDVVLLPGDITVTVHEANLDLSTFSFRCPKCDTEAVRPAGEEVRRLLDMARASGGTSYAHRLSWRSRTPAHP
jgi:endogenous inhibitor of DNA gyrase (YacG/DUF329 family)